MNESITVNVEIDPIIQFKIGPKGQFLVVNQISDQIIAFFIRPYHRMAHRAYSGWNKSCNMIHKNDPKEMLPSKDGNSRN